MGPIGITFLPSAEQAADGRRRGQLESELGQAIKILSLRLPRVLGARPIAPHALLTAPGASGLTASAAPVARMAPAGAGPMSPGAEAGGFNPHAAVFESMVRAMVGNPTAGTTTVAATPASLTPHIGFSDPGDYRDVSDVRHESRDVFQRRISDKYDWLDSQARRDMF